MTVRERIRMAEVLDFLRDLLEDDRVEMYELGNDEPIRDSAELDTEGFHIIAFAAEGLDVRLTFEVRRGRPAFINSQWFLPAVTIEGETVRKLYETMMRLREWRAAREEGSR